MTSLGYGYGHVCLLVLPPRDTRLDPGGLRDVYTFTICLQKLSVTTTVITRPRAFYVNDAQPAAHLSSKRPFARMSRAL